MLACHLLHWWTQLKGFVIDYTKLNIKYQCKPNTWLLLTDPRQLLPMKASDSAQAVNTTQVWVYNPAVSGNKYFLCLSTSSTTIKFLQIYLLTKLTVPPSTTMKFQKPLNFKLLMIFHLFYIKFQV